MFDLRDMSKPVAWPVRGLCPLPDGTAQEFEFTAFWEYPRRSELDALLAANGGSLLSQGFVPAKTFKALADRYLKGWQDLLADGTPLSFDRPEDKALVLDLDFMRTALVKSFFGLLNGEGARGNSVSSAAPGPAAPSGEPKKAKAKTPSPAAKAASL